MLPSSQTNTTSDRSAHDFAGLWADVREALRRIADLSESLAASGVDACEAQSIADVRSGAQVALEQMEPLEAEFASAVASGAAEIACEQVMELCGHISTEIVRDAVREDLDAVLLDLQQLLATKVGRHRNQVKALISNAQSLIDETASLGDRAETLLKRVQDWANTQLTTEQRMSQQESSSGVEHALRAIGRQLSFLGTRGAGSTGYDAAQPAKYRSVSEQMTATLDALGLPHSGVQFAGGASAGESTTDLINGLMNGFQPVERDGRVLFEPGNPETLSRAVPSAESQILGGASRVAARLVRAEADNVLDILDRLPNLSRFTERRGVTTAREMRDAVAARFKDLDLVLADPLGINLPRAEFTLRRAGKALADFFDYSNLERSLASALRSQRCVRFFPASLVRDNDETSERQTAVQTEELRREIEELALSFDRIVGHLRTPLSSTLGNTAARLEQLLTAADRSAQDLRNILIRTGTSLPEQDLKFFRTELLTRLDRPGGPVDISIGQLLDWILEVAAPYVGAPYRSATLEAEDFEILADELEAQAEALDALVAQAGQLDFAIRLPGPMRQLEEMHYQIRSAAGSARTLGAGEPSREGRS